MTIKGYLFSGKKAGVPVYFSHKANKFVDIMAIYMSDIYPNRNELEQKYDKTVFDSMLDEYTGIAELTIGFVTDKQ